MSDLAVTFICHATHDATVAAEICKQLEAGGLACWMAPRNIPAGDNYADAIVHGIRASATMLVLLSREANDSSFVHREVERAASLGKRLIALRLTPTTPEKGLELFLSGTQWIDAFETGMPSALENLRATLLRTSKKPEVPPGSSKWWRSKRLWAAVVLGSLAGAYIARPYVFPPVQPVHDSSPKDAKLTASTLMLLARKGDVAASIALFTEQARSRQSPARWSAMVAATRADLELATASPELILADPLSNRAVGAVEGSYFFVLAQRPRNSGYLCEQVLLREEADRWAAESYTYWQSESLPCVNRTDLQAALVKANELLEGVVISQQIAESEIAQIMKPLISVGSGWADYLRSLSNMLQQWQPATSLVTTVPLGNLVLVPSGPMTSGRFVMVRYAVDKAGFRQNLDLAMRQERDGVWRLAQVFITPQAF